MRYIAMLRGINLGQHNRISMAELTAMCEKLHMERLFTYLQSGNIAFDSKSRKASQLKKGIELAIQQQFTHHITVFIKTPMQLEKIINTNPFMKREGIDATKLHVTFLDNSATTGNLSIQTDGADEWAIFDDVIYLYCPGGYGRTKLTNNVFERKLKTHATTRNWKTVQALQSLANS